MCSLAGSLTRRRQVTILNIRIIDDPCHAFLLKGNVLVMKTGVVLDYETSPRQCTVVLSAQVTADMVPAQFVQDTFVVDIADINEAAVIVVEAGSVDEGAAPGTVVATVTVVDPDPGQVRR
jgi:hypothetical protein